MVLFDQFCLFQNAILYKILNLGFCNFKPNFLRMYFLLVAAFFLQSFWVDYCILNMFHDVLTFII